MMEKFTRRGLPRCQARTTYRGASGEFNQCTNSAYPSGFCGKHSNADPRDTEIARLTAALADTQEKLAGAYEAAEPIRSLIELIEAGEISGLHCSDEFGLYLLGDDREPVYCAVTMTLEQLGKIGSTNPDADATTALTRIKAQVYRDVAEWVRPQRNGVTATGEEFADAILARADAVERGE